MDPDALKALEAGYVYALQTPHGRLRIRSQHALCLMRDEIAKATGKTPQEVQDEYEERALLGRIEIEKD